MSRYELGRIVFFVSMIVFSPFEAAVWAQSFSCRLGAKPACLDYGDQVCSSLGKCVDQSAMCFDQYQCNYEGFTCKSNLSECLDSYEGLRVECNRLARNREELLHDYNRLGSDYLVLREEFDELEASLIQANSDLEKLRNCLVKVGDLNEVQRCLR